MDLIDSLKNLSAKISKQKDIIQTEEATKNAFILPFIAALGYDIFDPSEVIPEYTADYGNKKEEKVDYAIIIDGAPQIIFECKKCGDELQWEHAIQLNKYYASNTKTHIGVITNGIQYQFYADLDEANIMDKKPFLEINMLDLQDSLVQELKKMSKSTYNIENILTTAADLKYLKEAKRVIAEQYQNPNREFVSFIIKPFYTGIKTERVIAQFTDIVKRAFNQFINEKIKDRLKIAMSEDTDKKEQKIDEKPPEPIEEKKEIETTSEETETFYIIKSIVRDIIDIERLSMKDYKTVCNIIIDNFATKAFVKLYYYETSKRIGLMEDNNEIKFQIEKVDDIYRYDEKIIASLNFYLKPKEESNPLKID